MGVDASHTRFQATREQWESWLEEFSSSGKSAVTFCLEKGIPCRQMYYHQRRARKIRKGHGQGFIELMREPLSCNVWIDACGCRIQVERGFDAVLLRQVVEALS